MIGKTKIKFGIIGEKSNWKRKLPDELLNVGKRIVQSRKGLPLVVNLTVRIIGGNEKETTIWL